MMLGLIFFVARQSKRRKNGTCWFKWGPTILLCIASVFVLADLTRHVGQDAGWFGVWNHGEPCPADSWQKKSVCRMTEAGKAWNST